jgi:hypothetical protein
LVYHACLDLYDSFPTICVRTRRVSRLYEHSNYTQNARLQPEFAWISIAPSCPGRSRSRTIPARLAQHTSLRVGGPGKIATLLNLVRMDPIDLERGVVKACVMTEEISCGGDGAALATRPDSLAREALPSCYADCCYPLYC